MAQFKWEDVVTAIDRSLAQLATKPARVRALSKAGSYPYIPLNLHSFLEQLEMARHFLGYDKPCGCGEADCRVGSSSWLDWTGKQFVDVGCGIGLKLIIARQAGFIASGIELNADYAKAAEVLTSGYAKKVIRGNALRQGLW